MLGAYNLECAICNEKALTILRATYIVPVVKGGIDDNGNIKSNNTIKLTREKIKYTNNKKIIHLLIS